MGVSVDGFVATADGPGPACRSTCWPPTRSRHTRHRRHRRPRRPGRAHPAAVPRVRRRRPPGRRTADDPGLPATRRAGPARDPGAADPARRRGSRYSRKEPNRCGCGGCERTGPSPTAPPSLSTRRP